MVQRMLFADIVKPEQNRRTKSKIDPHNPSVIKFVKEAGHGTDSSPADKTKPDEETQHSKAGTQAKPWIRLMDGSGDGVPGCRDPRRVTGSEACRPTGSMQSSSGGIQQQDRRLTRQAYGYRDKKYLHLKIYGLPNLSARKSL
jgi:hypothetical protein